MIEEKKLNEAQSRAQQYIQEGVIKTKGKKEHVEFFLQNASDSLDCATALYQLTADPNKCKVAGLTSLNGSLWVINSSYYSMFYNVRALLDSAGITMKRDLSIHTVTFDSLIHFFYLTGKLQKKFVELYEEAKEEAAELLGQQVDQLMEDYFHERIKRGRFTYETG